MENPAWLVKCFYIIANMRQITLVLLITLASSALADEWLLETSDAEILGQSKIMELSEENFEYLKRCGLALCSALAGFVRLNYLASRRPDN